MRAEGSPSGIGIARAPTSRARAAAHSHTRTSNMPELRQPRQASPCSAAAPGIHRSMYLRGPTQIYSDMPGRGSRTGCTGPKPRDR
eukprot:9474707-Pyramimonas_sp.AAC.1